MLKFNWRKLNIINTYITWDKREKWTHTKESSIVAEKKLSRGFQDWISIYIRTNFVDTVGKMGFNGVEWIIFVLLYDDSPGSTPPGGGGGLFEKLKWSRAPTL